MIRYHNTRARFFASQNDVAPFLAADNKSRPQERPHKLPPGRVRRELSLAGATPDLEVFSSRLGRDRVTSRDTVFDI